MGDLLEWPSSYLATVTYKERKMRQRLSHFTVRLFVTALCMLLLSSPGLNTVYATPQQKGEIPPGVGLYHEQANPCGPNSVILTTIGAAIGAVVGSLIPVAGTGAGAAAGSLVGGGISYYLSLGCNDAVAENYAKVERAFRDAYREAEIEKASPGYPDDVGIHEWVGFPLQDFWGGTDTSGNPNGDGWGAIIWGGADANELPHYVGGGTWVAYKHAVYELGIVPGYPVHLEHQRDLVIMQEFRGGSWGDSAIIGGDNAWLVAGRHWEAYESVAGWSFLGNPTGPWHQNADGWYQQDFERGMILELDHNIRVVYNDGSVVEMYIP